MKLKQVIAEKNDKIFCKQVLKNRLSKGDEFDEADMEEYEAKVCDCFNFVVLI